MASLRLFQPRRELGRTGFRATLLGIGDIADRKVALADCVATVQRAMDAGLNVVDTAPAYEDGYSEEIVGRAVKGRLSFAGVIAQIMVLDIVFSLDSVITAVGMANHLGVMVAAVVAAVGVMMLSAEPIARFVDRHPTVKMLALSFLLLIGLSLVADGLGEHISKGYIYFAMGFSVFVEMINLRVRARSEPVHLHQAFKEDRR